MKSGSQAASSNFRPIRLPFWSTLKPFFVAPSSIGSIATFGATGIYF
jgi:hypothetical protein